MKIATLCYLKHKGKTLFIHRNKREDDLFKDYWNGLGGKLEANESPEECVIREMEEETGLTISNLKMKGILTIPNDRDSGETWYIFVFVAIGFEGELEENKEGELVWVDDDKISTLNIQEADKHFIKWLEKEKFFSAKFHYKGDELVDQKVSFY